MRRKIILAFILVATLINCFAQGRFSILNSKPNSFGEMMVDAINRSCEHILDIQNQIDVQPVETFYYCVDGFPEALQTTCSDSIRYNITWFSFYNEAGLPRWFKKKFKKGLSVSTLFFTINSNEVEIIIFHEFVRSQKNNSWFFELAEWDEFIYYYDCSTNEWHYKGCQFYGI